MAYGDFAAFTPVKFSLKLIEVLYNKTIYSMVTNTNYEGEIKKAGDEVVVRTAGTINLNPYTKGMTLVKQALNPTKESMFIDQLHYFSFGVDDVDEIQNDIPAMTEYAINAKKDMQKVIDLEILDYARRNVLGDNVLGGDYETGTVAVASDGTVTGTGTTFVALHVGGYFKADGHTKWYEVTARNSNTEIEIQDLGADPYSGGVISSGASYIIKGATPVTITKDTIYEKLVDLYQVLDASLTPDEGRFLVVNSRFKAMIKKAPEFIPAIESAYNGIVKEGHVGEIAGFQIYSTELVQGDNTNGYYFWAGTKEFMAFAAQIMKTSVIPSEADPNSFMGTCKGLLVFGRKVFEGNRGRGAIMRVIFG